MEAQQHRVFSRIDLFAGLPEAEMRALAQTAIPRTFESGESLFFEGEDCQGIWILTAGLVKIVKATPTGRQIVLGMQQAPATVAEVPVFDGGPYPATGHPGWTAVGFPAAITRFAALQCYDNVRPQRLPAELQDANPLQIWRLVEGAWSNS